MTPSTSTLKSLIIPEMMTCTNCILHATRLCVVPGYGPIPSRLFGLGQSPGSDEDKKGRPFIGRAGQVLRDALKAASLSEEDIFLHNVNACHPPGDRKTTPSEKKACRGWLEQTLTTVDPEILISFGDEATKALIPNEKSAISKIRGTFYTVMICGKPRVVMPSLHPSFVARNRSVLFPVLVKDLQLARDKLLGRSSIPGSDIPYGKHLATWDDIWEALQSPVVSIDFETTSLDRDADIIGIGVATKPGNGMYWPITNQQDLIDRIPLLKSRLEDPSCTKIIFNAKFESHIISKYGIVLDPVSIEDAILEAWLLGDNQSLGLKDLASVHLGQEMLRIEDLIGTGKKQKSMKDIQAEPGGIAKAVAYAAPDPDATLRLHNIFAPRLAARGITDLYKNVEMPMMGIITSMERAGMGLDPSKLDPAIATLRESMWNLGEDLWEMAGREFNPNSSDQTAELIYKELRIVPIPLRGKEGSKHPSTGAVVLAPYIDHPFIRGVLSYRAHQKLLTYAERLPSYIHRSDASAGYKDNRIHTHINQTGTGTGRVSSSDPNLQNIPARQRQDIDLPMAGGDIRKAFVSDRGCFLYAPDLSQIEMRVQAELSQDPNLMQVFLDGRDIHSNTVKILFGEDEEFIEDPTRRKSCRFIAKTTNFGIIYGLTAQGLLLRTPFLHLTISEAAKIIEDVYNGYPGIKEYQDRTIHFCRKNGYVVTLLGRRRYFPNINASKPELRSAAERAAINAPIQGGACDFFKKGMVACYNRLEELRASGRSQSRMIMQVHDELLFEGPFVEREMLENEMVPLMADAIRLSVPVKVDFEYGLNWGELVSV